ncbi:MAG: hypothetical protein CL912_27005 [Deltaproteobacteria bacterium]|nr:hypothetical protein [Deltaproteobacteria bacterium]
MFEELLISVGDIGWVILILLAGMLGFMGWDMGGESLGGPCELSFWEGTYFLRAGETTVKT